MVCCSCFHKSWLEKFWCALEIGETENALHPLLLSDRYLQSLGNWSILEDLCLSFATRNDLVTKKIEIPARYLGKGKTFQSVWRWSIQNCNSFIDSIESRGIAEIDRWKLFLSPNSHCPKINLVAQLALLFFFPF